LRNAANPDRLAVAYGQTTGDESDRMAAFESILRGGRTLNLIHVEKPHYPWNHFPDGRKFSNLNGELSDVFTEDGRWDGPTSLTDLALQRHMLETGFTDHLLGSLIARLRATGLWDRAIVVVTADHGGAVIAHDKRRNPTQTNLGQIAPVPLFIKAPGQDRGRVVDRHVCTTGILPAMARMLKIDYPWREWPCPAGVVRVANSPSGSTSLSFERVERLRDAYVARIARLFGAGTGWGPVLRLRPNQSLIGRRVDALRALPAGEGSASLEDSGLLRNVRPRAPVVLASLLRGTLDGVGAGEPLAAAVNGRIAAVGRSFAASDGTRFSLLVPPRRLRAGANRADIYRVAGRANRLRIQRLGP
jgi:hypothetical protein